MQPQTPVPLEVGRAGEHDLLITWQDNHASRYNSHSLRMACPCAGCVDELTGHIRIIGSSIAADVHPVKVSLIGRYAITIRWSDGHQTGIYPFQLLRKLCPCDACKPAPTHQSG